jgi:hypothetical protein
LVSYQTPFDGRSQSVSLMGTGVRGVSAPGRCEFVVGPHEVPPHLFIVRKQTRVGAGATEQIQLLALYYVLDGTVYPTPSLHASLGARTVRSTPMQKLRIVTIRCGTGQTENGP